MKKFLKLFFLISIFLLVGCGKKTDEDILKWIKGIIYPKPRAKKKTEDACNATHVSENS